MYLIKQSGGEPFDFPNRGLAQGFVDLLISSENEHPFQQYKMVLRQIFDGKLALKSLELHSHPELEGLIDHGITNTPQSQEYQALWQDLYPDVSLPSKDGWDRLGLENPLAGLASRKQEGFISDFGSEEDVKQQAHTEALDLVARGMFEQPEKLLAIGLKDELIPYLAKATKNKLITRQRAVRKSRKLEDTESDLSLSLEELAGRYLPQYEEEGGPVELEALGLDLASLSAGELGVIQDVVRGFAEGYTFDSKEGASFVQRWGPDYSRKSKMWERAKSKLKNK